MKSLVFSFSYVGRRRERLGGHIFGVRDADMTGITLLVREAIARYHERHFECH